MHGRSSTSANRQSGTARKPSRLHFRAQAGADFDQSDSAIAGGTFSTGYSVIAAGGTCRAHTMQRILAIARNTFRETVRDKILYNLILFALIMILSSLALGQLTLGNETKVILDLGLASISIFGTLIAIFIGIGLVYKELEKRTVYTLLAKPVHRHELILGKYLGLLFTLFANLAIMTVGLDLALLYTGGSGWDSFLRVVTALAILFSTFSTPALSALFTLFLWIIGHFGNALLGFGELVKSAFVKWLCRTLYYAIPNFSNFKIMDSRSILQSAGHFMPVDVSAILSAAFYCVLYTALVLSLSIAIFMRRDFK